jgi:hypothetical protein
LTACSVFTEHWQIAPKPRSARTAAPNEYVPSGEKDEHRLTVHGLSNLRNFYRELDSKNE